MTEKTSPAKKHDANAKESVADRKTEPKKSASANWSLRFLLVIVIFLLGSGASVYFLPALKERLPLLDKWVVPASKPDTLLAEKIAALEIRLARQGMDIQALQAARKGAAAPEPELLARLHSLEQTENNQIDQKTLMSQAARIDMLLSRMSQLEASFIPLSRSLADAQEMRLERTQLADVTRTQTEQLHDMENRLNKVEDFAARDNKGALIAFRIGELRRKVTSGKAYGAEIDALATMVSHGAFALNDQIAQSLDWLDQHRAGIVTGDKLRDRFDDLIPALIRSETSHKDDPWWKRAYNSTRNLIMIRKTENTTGENLDNIIAGAHRMLERLDLDQALALLQQLPDNIRQTLAAWIMQAEIYLHAEDELNRLESLTAGYYLDSEHPQDEETAL